jgi:hypothetical protein
MVLRWALWWVPGIRSCVTTGGRRFQRGENPGWTYPRWLLLFSVTFFSSPLLMLMYPTVVSNIGDLLIQLEVAEDPYFKRQDADVHVEVPITLTQVRVKWGCCG